MGGVLIAIAWAALFCALMLFPKSKERQNGIVWLPLCLLGCECFFAALAGVFSLVRIPAGAAGISAASLAVSAALVLYTYRGSRQGAGGRAAAGHGGFCHRLAQSVSPQGTGGRGLGPGRPGQQYYWMKGDVALAGALGLFAVCFFLYRFCGEYAIAYATNDPADRLSAAMHIVTEKSAIYTWPNMYFGHTSNAMFIEALRPLLPGHLFFRAFEIKDVFNLWLGGMLFFAALRRHSERGFARGAFAALAFLYVLAFPLSGALYGFSYLGISVELIAFLQIAAHMLLKQDVSPRIALLMVSFGCFGVGSSYTLFAPPLFIGSFLVVAYYILRVRREKRAFVPAQLAVFSWPAALAFIYSVLLDPGGQEELGTQLLSQGAIYFNYFSDALPFLPPTIFAVWALWKNARSEVPLSGERLGDAWAALALPAVFFAYQAVFFVMLAVDAASAYYYGKFNFPAWFFVLLLAGIGIAMACERWAPEGIRRGTGRRLKAYAACWAALAAVTLPFSVAAAYEEEPLPVALDLLASPFRIQADNLYLLGCENPYGSYYTEEFAELCGAAYELKQERGDPGFFANSVEAITDDPYAWFWVDALANERIILPDMPVGTIQRFGYDRDALLKSDAHIWVVLRHDRAYAENRKFLESFPKAFENDLGFVIEHL